MKMNCAFFKHRRFVPCTAAFLMGALVFLSGCQSTPQNAPVINKSDGVTDAMMAEPLIDGQVREMETQWADTLTRYDGRLEFTGDIDLIYPDGLSNIPVKQLCQKPLTQEKLDTLIHYFAKDSKLYAPQRLTKAQLSALKEKIQAGKGMFQMIFSGERRRHHRL